MTSYILKEEVSSDQALSRLEKHLKDESILEIGLNNKNEPFVRTDWYVYIAKLKSNTVKIPVIWSEGKKPYLIAGILIVIFLMFFIGGLITDIVVICVLVGLGLVNILKRKEISKMKDAMCEALNQ